MADNKSYTSLGGSNVTFDGMLRRFGVVTVMDAKVYDFEAVKNACGGDLSVKTVKEIYSTITTGSSTPTVLCELNTLKIANVTVEGPDKTVTGGQYNNPLIKYGKTARLEMQDALGNVDAIEAFGGGIVEHFTLDSATGKHTVGSEATGTGKADAFHVTEDFAGPRTIVGHSFFIDQASGQQVKVAIIFYQLLPDSLFNLTQDAEGDAAVFDLNGDLLTTNILVGQQIVDGTKSSISHGVFYSILPEDGIIEQNK